MKRAQLLAALVLLVIVLAGCANAKQITTPTATPDAGPTRTPYPTRKSRGVVTILADGQLAAVRPVLPLGFNIAGRLLTVAVQAGEVVAAGDLMAALDVPTDELENRLALARLNLETAEITLAQAEQDNADTLYKAKISLEKAKIRLEQAQAQNVDSPVTVAYLRFKQAETALTYVQEAYNQAWDSARDWELYMIKPTGAPPFEGPSLSKQLEAERESTQRSLESARDNVEIARAEYSQIASNRELQGYDLQVLPQDVQLAEYQVELLERGVDPLLALNVEKVGLEVESLEEQLEQLAKDAQLFAPWDGLVLSVEVAPGAQVGMGTPIVTLFDPSELQFHTTNLSERDLAQIRPGQAAQIILKAYPDQPLGGAIVRIASQASGMVGDAAAFTVVIQPDSTDLDLRPGMTGRAEIPAGD